MGSRGHPAVAGRVWRIVTPFGRYGRARSCPRYGPQCDKRRGDKPDIIAFYEIVGHDPDESGRDDRCQGRAHGFLYFVIKEKDQRRDQDHPAPYAQKGAGESRNKTQNR